MALRRFGSCIQPHPFSIFVSPAGFVHIVSHHAGQARLAVGLFVPGHL
jgi:hypothetical protein